MAQVPHTPFQSYTALMHQEEMSWDMVADLTDEQDQLVDADAAEVARYEELKEEISGWRKAAEDANRQMELMEACIQGCKPMKGITLPW